MPRKARGPASRAASVGCAGAEAPTRRARRSTAAAFAARAVTGERHGRLIAVGYLGATDLYAQRVRNGWTSAYRRCPRDHVPEQRRAEADEAGARRGPFVLPGDWRRGERPGGSRCGNFPFPLTATVVVRAARSAHTKRAAPADLDERQVRDLTVAPSTPVNKSIIIFSL
jgi:hypothetical protein